MPSDDEPSGLFALLRYLLRSVTGAGDKWDGSELPEDGATCIVVDGLASPSNFPERYVHWLAEIGPDVETAISGTVCRGLSYLEPGLHYGSTHTNVDLNWANQIVRPYIPTTPSISRVTYLAFSLGATLTLTGVGEGLNLGPIASSVTANIAGLVLIQPALAMKQNYYDAATADFNANKKLPLIVASMLSEKLRTELAARVIRSTVELTNAGITVHLRYWEGDDFLDYPPALINSLVEAGVDVQPVVYEINAAEKRGSFVDHARVSRHEPMKREILTILAAL